MRMDIVIVGVRWMGYDRLGYETLDMMDKDML